MSQNKSPQLFMIRDNLKDMPQVNLPAGYRLRSFKKGDEKNWNYIIQTSFENELEFSSEIAGKEYFKPERILFICKEKSPVATATSWHKQELGENTGYLHMVGVLPEHRGKSLGYQISLSVLHQMKQEGFKRAVLKTDDFRIPAIVTYLKLNFKPKIIHSNQYERWKTIIEEIERDDIQIRIPEK